MRVTASKVGVEKMTEHNGTNNAGLARLLAARESIRPHLGVLLALIILCTLLSLSTEAFMSTTNTFNVLRQIAVNVFLACGMTMVILLGGIDLSVGAVVALSGCISATLITNFGVNVYLAMISGVAIGALVGFVNGTIISRTSIPPFIVTLAFMNVCRGLARVVTNNKTVPVNDEVYSFVGSGYVSGVPIHVVFVVVVVAVLGVVVNRTRFGRNIYAVGGNRQAAIYSGVDARSVTLRVYTLCGLLAGCAGILTSSRTMVGQYSLGEGAEMDAITAVVLGGTSMSGGIGSIAGTVIGCVIVGVLNNGMNLLGIDSSWQFVVQGVVVLLAVFIDYLRKTGAIRGVRARMGSLRKA